MVDGLFLRESVIYGEITIESDTDSVKLEAIVDTGASKTLIPERVCNSLDLIRVESKDVWGICPTSVRVNIYLG